MSIKILCIGLLTSLASLSAHGANPYHVQTDQEFIYLGLGIGATAAGLAADSQKAAPDRSSIAGQDRSHVPSLDRRVAGNWSDGARQRSDIILVSTLLLPLSLPANGQIKLSELAMLYGETTLLTLGGVSLAKGLVDRSRPYTYGSSASDDRLYRADSNRSFFSGHAAHIAASSVFFAKVYSDLEPESRYTIPIWVGAGLLSGYGGWLRMEAGMHFPSDVALGWVWGGLMGYWVPELHRTNRKVSVSPIVSPGQAGFTLRSQF